MLVVPLGSGVTDEALQAHPGVFSMLRSWQQHLCIVENQPIRQECEWL